MSKGSKKKLNIFGSVFLVVMASLFFWMFQQVLVNYKNMILANKLMDQMIDYQSSLTRVHEHRSLMIKKQLEQTRELMEQYRLENEQLQQRVDLLGEVGSLQDTISRLQQENIRIREEMETLKLDRPLQDESQLKSLKEGRTLIAERRREIKMIRRKIHQLKKDRYTQRVADQKEVDRIESLLGNKGYLIQSGKICSPSMVVPVEREVNIEVQLVP